MAASAARGIMITPPCKSIKRSVTAALAPRAPSEFELPLARPQVNRITTQHPLQYTLFMRLELGEELGNAGRTVWSMLLFQTSVECMSECESSGLSQPRLPTFTLVAASSCRVANPPNQTGPPFTWT